MEAMDPNLQLLLADKCYGPDGNREPVKDALISLDMAFLSILHRHGIESLTSMEVLRLSEALMPLMDVVTPIILRLKGE